MRNKIKLVLTSIIVFVVTLCIVNTYETKAATSERNIGLVWGWEDNYELPSSIHVDGSISINSNVEVTKYFSDNNQKYYLQINMPKSGRLELCVSNKNNSGSSKDCRIAVLNSDVSFCYASDYITSVGIPSSQKYYLYLYQGTYYVELSTRNCSGFSEGIKANAIYTDTNLTKNIESYQTAPSISLNKQSSYIMPYGATNTIYKFTLKRRSKVTISGSNDSFSNIQYKLSTGSTYDYNFPYNNTIGFIKESKSFTLEKGTYYIVIDTGGSSDGYSLDKIYGGYYKLKVTAKDMVSKIKIKPSKKKKVYEVGAKVKLKAKLSPTSVKGKKVKWSTSNKNVATVSKKGVVKTHESGCAVITAEADGIYGKWTIKVRAKKQNIVSVTTTFDGDYNYYWDEWIYDYDLNITLNSKYNDDVADYEYWISTNKKRWIKMGGETSASYSRGKTIYAVCTDLEKKGTYYLKIRRVSKSSNEGKKVYSKWSNIKKFVIK